MIKQKVLSPDQIVVQTEGNIVSDMGGEKVMLSIHNGKYYNLGIIGGEIWERIEEPVRIQTVIDSLISQYEVTETHCLEQVTNFLDSLLNEQLIKILS